MVRILHYSDLETALDNPDQVGALAETIEARRGAEALVVGTGDNTAPSALALVTEGQAVLPVFEELAPDADTFGNHDFDFGPATARRLAGAAPQPWLCANASRDGDRFAADATTPSRLVDADGTAVGLVGVAHPKTDEINPAAEAVTFEEPAPAIRREAEALRDRGAEHVVVLSHCGRLDEEIARAVDVTAILGGHVHDVHTETVAGTLLVRPGRAGEYVSEVTLDDAASVTIHEVDGAVDADAAARVRDQLETHGLDEVVTETEEPVERTERAVTVAESPIGNFVADALRWQTGADVALSPPGAIRAGDPLVGELTAGELMGLTPYSDDLLTVELPGRRLREAFVAVPFGYHDDDHPTRYCSHVSGAEIRWDDDAGQLERATVGGEEIEPSRRYTVAVADYLVETDHVVPAVDEGDVVANHVIACEAIPAYARAEGVDPSAEGRVERPALW